MNNNANDLDSRESRTVTKTYPLRMRISSCSLVSVTWDWQIQLCNLVHFYSLKNDLISFYRVSNLLVDRVKLT